MAGPGGARPFSPGQARARTGEIRSLTGLRGVAAALVMLYHAGPASGSALLDRALRHGYLMIDLFFVLSGFVIALSHPDIAGQAFRWPAYRRFLARRLARVYPLYLLSTALSLLLFAWLHLRGFESQLWHRPLVTAEIANALMVQNWGLSGSFNGAAWSISTEWMAYILFPVLSLAALRTRGAARLAFTASVVALLVLLSLAPDLWPWRDAAPRQGPLDRTSFLSCASLLRCGAEFCLGLQAQAVHARMLPTLDRFGGSLALACLAAIACLATLPVSDCAIVLLYPALIVGACGRGPVRSVLSFAPVHRLGVNSYSFYMLHVFVLDARDGTAATLRLAGLPDATPAVLVASFILAAALASLTHRFVERPSSTALRRLLLGRQG